MARTRIKVAVLIGALDVGGSESDIVRTFPLLNRDDFEIVVFEFNHEGTLKSQLTDAGIRVVSRRTHSEFETAGSNGAFAEAFERFAVLRWIVAQLRAEKPDITHSVLPHSYVYQVAAGMLARSRAKQVMSRHSLNFYGGRLGAINRIERTFLHRRLDIAIGNSRAILDELAEEGVDPAKLRLVRTGVDVAKYRSDSITREGARASLGIDPGAFVMVAVGNLHPYKGHDDLLRACALAAEQLPAEWLLLIAGRDEQGNRAAYESFIAENGLTDHVRLLGEIGDVPSLFRAADLMCHPSHHEGMGIAIAEAMSVGLPVVATNVGGIPELVAPSVTGAPDDAETGWLVPPHDPEHLAEALVAAASDADRRAAMGTRARARVDAEFSLASSVKAYEAVYRELAP